MKQRDPRINASLVTFKDVFSTFLMCNTICAVLIEIYALMHHVEAQWGDTFQETMTVIFGLGGFIVFVSIILTLFNIYWRVSFTFGKISILSKAARKVAEGDYTVRIPSRRKDGKKDEMEVLYEDFNTMVERLGEKKILREDFLSNVSHEFKTPLSIINSYVTPLQSGALSEQESLDYLERVRKASAQLSDMVGNILQISRLENGKITAEKRSFDLGEQLAQTVLNLDRALSEKEIEVEAQLDETAFIYSDPGLLQIVWNNILSNAIKFTPQGGGVRIGLKKEGGEWAVAIGDSGCGIEKENLERIFEKFYQVDSSHSTKGNGLGLTMVKEILELLQGRIQVKSVPGEGTEFRVILPEGEAPPRERENRG